MKRKKSKVKVKLHSDISLIKIIFLPGGLILLLLEHLEPQRGLQIMQSDRSFSQESVFLNKESTTDISWDSSLFWGIVPAHCIPFSILVLCHQPKSHPHYFQIFLGRDILPKLMTIFERVFFSYRGHKYRIFWFSFLSEIWVGVFVIFEVLLCLFFFCFVFFFFLVLVVGYIPLKDWFSIWISFLATAIYWVNPESLLLHVVLLKEMRNLGFDNQILVFFQAFWLWVT